MFENERYNTLNSFLRDKFKERVLKICIDGGFTCPNRDGSKGKGGCIFCSENGSGEHIHKKDIKKQIEGHLSSYRGQRAKKFIAYFQNFTNTYGSIEVLKDKYDSILSYDEIVALAVATRPDCIDEDVAKLLSSYKDKYYVFVELGLQTYNDDTKEIINCKYTSNDFENAVKILNRYDIDVVAHIMIGLPNEDKKDLKNTINFLNRQNIKGLKIHSTYVVKNTKLADMYLSGDYTPLTLEEYIERAIYCIENIRPDIIIHRISGDAPKDILIAPEWNKHKKWIKNGIEKALKERNTFQGKLYKK